jgi:hypothetical protein
LPNYTTNYGLKKPLGTEYYNIDDHNQNMDIIDTELKNTNNTINNHLADKANPHQVTATQTGALVSVDGVSNAGGNIDLVAGANIAITPDNTNKKITIAGTGTWPNADKVDSLHFRVLNGSLQYSTDGSVWYNVSNTVTVQRGYTDMTTNTLVNVTISEVDLSKSFVTASFKATNNYEDLIPSVRLTSSTNLELSRDYGGNSTVVAWEVVQIA